MLRLSGALCGVGAGGEAAACTGPDRPRFSRAEHWDGLAPPVPVGHPGCNFMEKRSEAFQNIYLQSFFRKLLKGLSLFFEQNLTLLEVNAEADFILENPISP